VRSPAEAALKSARWQQIDSIFQSALELDPYRRAAFLNQSCGSDPEVRKEVESLLSFYEKEGGLVESSAFSEGLRAMASAPPGDLTVGQNLGSYKIMARLGVGGTAEVYLALDTRLGRTVALKTLHPDNARDESAMRRFRQEARAVSALNHPNIVTIHEIVQIDELYVIAQEFIEGETLRSRISKAPLTLIETIDVTSQVASALSAAHRAGIIHRDIKPENIMIRSDGYVKVLDFGLAKLARSEALFEDLSESARAMSTQPGTVMGTISYMSPEQARGLETDSRTDIWSLGVVLYEMIVGRAPFEGATATDVIVSILEREPAEPIQLQKRPEKLLQVIAKCLAKEARERYQTIDELLAEIRSLKRQIEMEAQLEGARPSDLTGVRDTTVRPGSTAVEAQDGQSVSVRRATISLFVVLSVLAGCLAVVRLSGHLMGQFDPFRPASHLVTEPISRLTTDGRVQYAALSPDGKYLACVIADSQNQGLIVRQVADTAYNQIIEPSAFRFRGLTFSPDSTDVYYVAGENNKKSHRLYRVSILGGSPRRILDNVDSPVTFSPDRKQVGFVRDYQDRKESALVIAQIESGEERVLATRKEPNQFSIFGPAWSPDGKVIAISAHNADSDGTYMSVVEIKESDGSERSITSDRWSWIKQVAWLKDGDGLIISGKQNSSTPYRVYEIGYPAGPTENVTNDLSDYHGVSLTSDSVHLVSIEREDFPSIWVASAKDDFKKGVPVFRWRGRAYAGISWTPTGQIVYVSTETGTADIWIMDADGKNQKQLTIDAHTDYSPVATPDGRHIVFVSNRGGSFNLWRMDVDGGHLVRLTSGNGEYLPQCSPDGWVVYTSFSGDPGSWKVPLAGGDPVRVDIGDSIYGVVSPDGKSIVCRNESEQRGGEPRIAVFPFDRSSRQPTFFDLPISEVIVKWTPDGRALTYAASDDDLYNIWNKPIHGGAPKQVTDTSANEVLDFAWSSDGKRLAYILGTRLQNAVHIKRIRVR
jgi:serine/threonine protein kinase/Tol biopolymer transport system component